MADYPDCGYLGSDATELQAFAAHLRLREKLVNEGHTAECAAVLSGMKNAECICGFSVRKEPSDG